MRRDRISQVLDMQRLKVIRTHAYLQLLNMIIGQVLLINKSRLASCANNASVTCAMYDLTFFQDYKIVNVIQEYIMQTITTSHGPHMNVVNKPSSISADVTESQIK
jgi:hypothetical protein